MNRQFDLATPESVESVGGVVDRVKTATQGVTFHPDALDKSSENSSVVASPNPAWVIKEETEQMTKSFKSIRDRTQTPMYQKAGVTAYSEVKFGNKLTGQDIAEFRSENALSSMSKRSSAGGKNGTDDDDYSEIYEKSSATTSLCDEEMTPHISNSKANDESSSSSEDEDPYKIPYTKVRTAPRAAVAKITVVAPQEPKPTVAASVGDLKPAAELNDAEDRNSEVRKPKGGLAWEVDAEELRPRSRTGDRIRSASHSGVTRRFSLVEPLPARLTAIRPPETAKNPLPAIGDTESIEAFVRKQEEAEERRQDALDRKRSVSRLNRRRCRQARARRDNDDTERQRSLNRKLYVDDVKSKIHEENQLKIRKRRELERVNMAENAFQRRVEKEAILITRSLSRSTVRQMDADRRREAIRDDRVRTASRTASRTGDESGARPASRGRPISRVGAQRKKDASDIPSGFRGKSRLCVSPVLEPDSPWGDHDGKTNVKRSPPLEYAKPRIVMVKPASPTNQMKTNRNVNTPIRLERNSRQKSKPIETWHNFPNHPNPQSSEKEAIAAFFDGIKEIQQKHTVSISDLQNEIDENGSEASMTSEEDIILPPSPPGHNNDRKTPEPTLSPTMLARHHQQHEHASHTRKLERPKAAKLRRSLLPEHIKHGNRITDTSNAPSIDGNSTNPPTPIPSDTTIDGTSGFNFYKPRRNKKCGPRPAPEDEAYEREYRKKQIAAEKAARKQTLEERERLKKSRKRSKVILVGEASQESMVDNCASITDFRRKIEKDRVLPERRESFRREYSTGGVVTTDIHGNTYLTAAPRYNNGNVKSFSYTACPRETFYDPGYVQEQQQQQQQPAAGTDVAVAKTDEEHHHGRWCRFKKFCAKNLNPTKWFSRNRTAVGTTGQPNLDALYPWNAHKNKWKTWTN